MSSPWNGTSGEAEVPPDVPPEYADAYLAGFRRGLGGLEPDAITERVDPERRPPPPPPADEPVEPGPTEEPVEPEATVTVAPETSEGPTPEADSDDRPARDGTWPGWTVGAARGSEEDPTGNLGANDGDPAATASGAASVAGESPGSPLPGRGMSSWKLAQSAALAVALIVVVVESLLLVRHLDDYATSALDSGKAASSATDRPTSPANEDSTTMSEPAVESGSRIELASPSYVGRPFETIRLAGRYLGVHTPRTLRVQLRRVRIRQSTGWTQFPLPAVTQPSGRFRAYVELPPGRYRVRLVDPDQDRASKAVTVLVS